MVEVACSARVVNTAGGRPRWPVARIRSHAISARCPARRSALRCRVPQRSARLVEQLEGSCRQGQAAGEAPPRWPGPPRSRLQGGGCRPTSRRRGADVVHDELGLVVDRPQIRQPGEVGRDLDTVDGFVEAPTVVHDLERLLDEDSSSSASRERLGDPVRTHDRQAVAGRRYSASRVSMPQGWPTHADSAALLGLPALARRK